MILDQIEVLHQHFNIIQVRMRRTDAELAAMGEGEQHLRYHRYCLVPGQDIDSEPQAVKDVAAEHWTAEVIAAFQAAVASAS